MVSDDEDEGDEREQGYDLVRDCAWVCVADYLHYCDHPSDRLA